MSNDNRRYQKPKVSFSDRPYNTHGVTFLEIKLDSIEVAEWHPLPGGQGKPTQVHISMVIDGVDVPLVMRFKGPGTLDALISALAVHRLHVWPDLDYTEAEHEKGGGK